MDQANGPQLNQRSVEDPTRPNQESGWNGLFKRPAVFVIFSMCTVVAAVLIFFYISLDGAINKINSEREERTDQACRGYELQYAEEVKELRNTYKLLEDPPPEFVGLLKNPLVVDSILEDERNVQNDRDEFGVYVAPYCDEPGVGLEEPDPVVPERPKAVTDLIESNNG